MDEHELFEKLVEAVIWMSGSSDFSFSGPAHTEWCRIREEVLFPALKGLGRSNEVLDTPL